MRWLRHAARDGRGVLDVAIGVEVLGSGGGLRAGRLRGIAWARVREGHRVRSAVARRLEALDPDDLTEPTVPAPPGARGLPGSFPRSCCFRRRWGRWPQSWWPSCRSADWPGPVGPARTTRPIPRRRLPGCSTTPGFWPAAWCWPTAGGSWPRPGDPAGAAVCPSVILPEERAANLRFTPHGAWGDRVCWCVPPACTPPAGRTGGPSWRGRRPATAPYRSLGPLGGACAPGGAGWPPARRRWARCGGRPRE